MIHMIEKALQSSPHLRIHGVRVVAYEGSSLKLSSDGPPETRDASGGISTSAMFTLAEASAHVAAQIMAARMGVVFRQKSSRIKYYGSARERLYAQVSLPTDDIVQEGGVRIEVGVTTVSGTLVAHLDSHFTASPF